VKQELSLWPKKLQDGIDIAKDFHRENSSKFSKKINKIAFIGMGGSGIAGRIVKTFLDKTSEIPSFIIESPEIPKFIDTETLAIVSSYSGNTWESVCSVNILTNRFIPTIILANSGEILEIADVRNIPSILVPKSTMPRLALGSFLGIILTLFDLLGIINGSEILQGLSKQVSVYLNKFESDKSYFNDFLEKASDVDFLHIFGVSGDTAAFSYRAQTQFNENSKIDAVSSFFPEMNHNLLLGFSKSAPKQLAIPFTTEFLMPNMQLAVDSSLKIMENRGVNLYKPPILGDNWVEQLFHIILWSDFASYYLGKERNIDPEEVGIIDELKSKCKRCIQS
jgi:glucose/mannose-6-phosphate isomerase